jgi:hypothetical protein
MIDANVGYSDLMTYGSASLVRCSWYVFAGSNGHRQV